jgi:serine/threonine protein kinase
MGTVLDGYDAVIDRRVAIKTITLPDPNDAEAQDELARFRREAQAAGRLTHPNIVAVYDYGEDGTIAYIVMEYAPGTELKKILDKGDRLPPAETVRIMEGVLAGLQYSHERGVVHRDIKPGNIILSSDGTVKIADFGIARIESSSMTQAGTVMGTPAYMSPEQFMGQTVDARTDIYSAGVMLYQLLTGERPFEGGMTAIMHKALNTEPPRPSELSVTAPSALDPVVARAMAKRPGDRYENAAAFARAIRDAMSGDGISLPAVSSSDATMISPRGIAPPARPAAVSTPAPAVVAAKPKSRAPLFAGVAVAVLAVAGIGGFFALSGDKPATPVVASVTPASPNVPALPPQTQLPDAPVRPASTSPVTTPAAPSPAPSTSIVAATPPPQVSPAAPVSVSPAVTQPPPPQVVAPPTPSPVAAAPSPQPAPPPTPAPAALPQQVASVAATPAMIRDALAGAITSSPCSLVRSNVDGRGVAVSGLVGRSSESAIRNRARESLPANASPDSLNWRLDVFDGPYCGVLDTIRPAAMQPVSVGLRNGATKLRKDDDIVPVVTMPDGPSWLVVDYFSSDGGVTHLHPTAASPATQDAARSVETPRKSVGRWTRRSGPT